MFMVQNYVQKFKVKALSAHGVQWVLGSILSLGDTIPPGPVLCIQLLQCLLCTLTSLLDFVSVLWSVIPIVCPNPWSWKRIRHLNYVPSHCSLTDVWYLGFLQVYMVLAVSSQRDAVEKAAFSLTVRARGLWRDTHLSQRTWHPETSYLGPWLWRSVKEGVWFTSRQMRVCMWVHTPHRRTHPARRLTTSPALLLCCRLIASTFSHLDCAAFHFEHPLCLLPTIKKLRYLLTVVHEFLVFFYYIFGILSS